MSDGRRCSRRSPACRGAPRRPPSASRSLVPRPHLPCPSLHLLQATTAHRSCFGTPSPSTPAAAAVAAPCCTPPPGAGVAACRGRRRRALPVPGGHQSALIYCSREPQLPRRTCQRHYGQSRRIKNRNEVVWSRDASLKKFMIRKTTFTVDGPK